MSIGTATQKVPALRIGRAGRLPWRFAAGVLSVVVVLEAVWLTLVVIPENSAKWQIGIDYVYYRDLGARWLSSGSFYFERQLAGPYPVRLLDATGYGDVLYPPTALLLFVPFAVAPAILWWAVPIMVTGYCLSRLRPTPMALALMLALLAWPRAIGAYLFGNTDMWVVAAVAAGCVWGWPALLVTLKPTFAPLALLGIRRRSWWVVAALGLAFVLLTVPLWADYLTAMRNARGLDIGYSLGSLPLVCAPLVPVLLRYRVPKRNGERRRGDDHLEGARLAP